MPYKILAISDLHLGKSSSGVKAGIHETASKYTWKRILDWSVENEVDALVLSGDIIDRDDRYYEAIGQLQSGFEKLRSAGIEVIMVAGNHDFDVTTEIMKDGRYDNVTLLGANGEWEVISRKKGELTIQFVGWSFPNQYQNEDPTREFSATGLNPENPVIGLLHGDVYNGESSYGPISLNNLTSKPVHAWILGHIHKPEVLSNAPLVFYPGSPHAMSAKETGVHGAVMLNVFSSSDISIESIPFSPVRYQSMDIDISEWKEESDFRTGITSEISDRSGKIQNELSSVKYLVWDITLTGTHEKIRDVELWGGNLSENYEGQISGTEIQVRKIQYNLRPSISNLKELANEPSPAGRLADTILAIEEGRSTEFLTELIRSWEKKVRELESAVVYQPIRNAFPDKMIKNDEHARQYILKECNRLLSEIMSSRHE